MHNRTERRRPLPRRGIVAGVGTAALVAAAALAHAGIAGADDNPTTTVPPTVSTQPPSPTTVPPTVTSIPGPTTTTTPAAPTTVQGICEDGQTVHVEVPANPPVTVPPEAICVLPATPIEEPPHPTG
jgi:hypothetical protein